VIRFSFHASIFIILKAIPGICNRTGEEIPVDHKCDSDPILKQNLNTGEDQWRSPAGTIPHKDGELFA
jgi:hypothetical protein